LTVFFNIASVEEVVEFSYNIETANTFSLEITKVPRTEFNHGSSQTQIGDNDNSHGNNRNDMEGTGCIVVGNDVWIKSCMAIYLKSTSAKGRS